MYLYWQKTIKSLLKVLFLYIYLCKYLLGNLKPIIIVFKFKILTQWWVLYLYIHAYIYNIDIYNQENNELSRLSPQWLCSNLCTWARDVHIGLHIANRVTHYWYKWTSYILYFWMKKLNLVEMQWVCSNFTCFILEDLFRC